ncbi:HD domain-containing protein [Candidatus Kaiserbacteria bacterium]|nr:HD domain-containing protein [Candidatus Kaiserbacteria bacterium]
MDSLLQFVELLQKYRSVERAILVKGTDRVENDTEHSYSLAMLAWYISSTYKLDLDLEKLFLYALAHDLVEVYAGDIQFQHITDEVARQKHDAEQKAAERLKKEFPEFPELHTVIEQYEKREDQESKFIYALDKVEPALNIYIDRGRSWRKEGITLDVFKRLKLPKVAEDPTIESLLKELIVRLENEHDNLFLSSKES